ncbi:HPr family phosphocarrier protein [Paenibacillus sp. Z6-24]
MATSNTNNAAVVEIAQTAGQYTSSIVLQYETKFIDVKSILGLFTTLVANHEYELHVHGPDEDAARAAVVAAFEKHGLSVKLADK